MKISRDNYEIWFLDYLEERLDPGQREEVHQFLLEHPDLADELDAFPTTLTADKHLSFSGKAGLKKSLFDEPEYFESTALAFTEGDLATEESIQFENWLENHSSRQIFVESLQKCKLKPDTRLSFPGKERLRRKSSIKLFWPSVAAVAAILLLALFVFEPGTERVKQASPMVASGVSPAINKPLAESKSNPRLPAEPLPIARKSAKMNHSVSPAVSGSSSPPEPLKMVTAREIMPVTSMQPKSYAVVSDFPVIYDLAPINERENRLMASTEISLTDYLKDKLNLLKAEEPTTFITREEVTLAGLHLFSRLPGNHLTGKKGHDGRLTSISFNTQLLAFSIPVNR
jgi:hypothetical protein